MNTALYMARRRFKKTAMALTIAAVCTPQLALADGHLVGSYLTEANNFALEGAIVRLEELNLETRTTRDGSFLFPPVKAGQYTLTIQYLGAEKQTRTVQIMDGERREEAFILSSNTTEQVLVVGQAASINNALNQQRVADNIISVVNADAIGQLPDANAADALKRIPGVSVELDQGEGRKVSVRGLSPDLNSVTVNGAVLPSPNPDDRSVNLDVISSDILESLEVTKSLTPDMDGNSIGGTVNIKSLSAFDRDGLFHKLTVEGGYDKNSGESSPKIAGTVSNIFSIGDGQDNLGIAAALSWHKRKFGSENVETGGSWDFDSSPALLEEIELRDYEITRERLSGTLNFDYRLNENTDLYLNTLYSKYTDTEQRNALIMELDGGAEEGIATTVDGAAERELKDREENQTIYSVMAGGSSRVDDWTMDYSFAHSYAEEEKPNAVESVFADQTEDLAVTFSNSKIPQISGDALLFDATNYEFDEAEVSNSESSDEINSLKLDLTKDFELNENPALIKFGAKVSQRERQNQEQVYSVSGSGQTLATLGSGNVDYDLGSFGPGINASAVRDLIAGETASLEEKDSIVNDYTMSEDVNAAYIMGRVDIDNWRLLTGVRYEDTSFAASGFEWDEDTEIATANSFTNDYDHWLPAFHARYKFNDNTLVRGAWTNSVVRPTFEQSRPGIEEEGGEAEGGNPHLKATESSNFDLGFEHYFDQASAFSAYAFYKDIENFIYETNLGAVLGYDELVSFDNGSKAEVYGLELAYSHKFSGNSFPLDGLLFSSNLTLADSEATISAEGEADRDISLPGQSDITANITLGYEMDRWNMRLTANHKTKYLDEVGEDADERYDVYVDDHTQLDFSANYEVDENIQVYFQANNITDEPFYKYVNGTQYNAQYEEYGPTFKLGVTLTNF